MTRKRLPLGACLIALSVLAAAPASAQTLRIYHIDVEQADSALVVMPNGKSLLIDSGNNGHGKRIKKVMDAAGVTQIDAYVTSHYHTDHFGGIDDLVNARVPVLESYDRGRRDLVSAQDKSKTRYKEYMRAVGEDAHALHPGDTIPLDPLVTIRCLAASGAVIGGSPVSSSDENDLSVSLLLEFAGFKAFFAGDTHELVEQVIEAADLVKDIDLYKASHHGSDTSSSAAFMADLTPTVIVISNGSNAAYHHPRLKAQDIYQALVPTPVVIQTNRCKLSLPCKNVEPEFIADPETSGKDGTIEITADAVSHTYTVKYGLNTVRTFAFKAAGGAPRSGPSSAPGAVPGAVIESLLPNPAGDDEQLEEIALRNAGAAPVSLAGWTLKDRSGLIWALTGSLAAGQSQTFRRSGQPLSLNNAGDEILLLDNTGTERDRFAYPTSAEGKRIITTH